MTRLTPPESDEPDKDFVECDQCGLGHAMRKHEPMVPREWAHAKGWATDIDGMDFCPECTEKRRRNA
jgi:hypothetical protein